MSTTSVRRQSKPSARRQPPRRRSKEIESPQAQLHQRRIPPFIHLVRLIVCGLGATTIMGTAISVIYPPTAPVTSKGKLPSPPKITPPIPAITPPSNSTPKTLPNSLKPQSPSPAADPQKTKLDVKSTPDKTVTPGFPNSVFIKPSTIRP